MHKKFYAVVFILLNISAFAQSSYRINYQGVARDRLGEPIGSVSIGLKLELKRGNALLFSESKILTASPLGLFSTQIGNTAAGLDTISWQNGPISLQVGIDVTGGTNYTDLGSQELVYTPLAIHAKSVPASYTNWILTHPELEFPLLQEALLIRLRIKR